MKNIISISAFLFVFSFIASAQFSLTYKTHGLLPNHTHTTQYVENISPGRSGENQIWDFTDLKCGKINTSEILDAKSTKNTSAFEMANIAVAGDENYFYYKVNESANELYGMTTPNSVVTYEKPIVKMVYPFSYGDFVEGKFFGEGLYFGQIVSNVSGEYKIYADAYGTLLLPNNVSIENVLRIKTVNHIFETACKTTEFLNIKYLWYSADSRLPIMVVMVNKRISEGKEVVTNKGYYNERHFEKQVILSNSDLLEHAVKVYPNPFSDIINISYMVNKESTVTVALYNSLGQKIETLVDNKRQVGFQTINYKVNSKYFTVDNYFVKIAIGDKITTKKLIMIK